MRASEAARLSDRADANDMHLQWDEIMRCIRHQASQPKSQRMVHLPGKLHPINKKVLEEWRYTTQEFSGTEGKNMCGFDHSFTVSWREA